MNPGPTRRSRVGPTRPRQSGDEPRACCAPTSRTRSTPARTAMDLTRRLSRAPTAGPPPTRAGMHLRPGSIGGPCDPGSLGVFTARRQGGPKSSASSSWVKPSPYSVFLHESGRYPRLELIEATGVLEIAVDWVKSPWQKAPLHSTSDASRLTALFLGRICPICSLVTPCQPGASPVSVQRGVSPRALKGNYQRIRRACCGSPASPLRAGVHSLGGGRVLAVLPTGDASFQRGEAAINVGDRRGKSGDSAAQFRDAAIRVAPQEHHHGDHDGRRQDVGPRHGGSLAPARRRALCWKHLIKTSLRTEGQDAPRGAGRGPSPRVRGGGGLNVKRPKTIPVHPRVCGAGAASM